MFKNIVKTKQYEISEYDNSVWLKVFFHNHSTKENFKDENEARHCNSEFKYSILDEINPSMRFNGKYEFIMDFPDDNVYIRWLQNKNPLKELDGKSKADGLNITEDNRPLNSRGFYGLTRSTLKYGGEINSFLDGMPDSGYWFYAVGMYESSAEDYKNKGIPTYKKYTSCLRLWIKIDPKGRLRRCSCNNYKARMSTGSIIMITFVMSS